MLAGWLPTIRDKSAYVRLSRGDRNRKKKKLRTMWELIS